MSDTNDKIDTDRKIFMAMRKTLSSIIRDTTPKKGMKHILEDSTIADIRACLGFISAREQELAKQAGVEINERPRYIDEPKTSSVISIDALTKNKKGR